MKKTEKKATNKRSWGVNGALAARIDSNSVKQESVFDWMVQVERDLAEADADMLVTQIQDVDILAVQAAVRSNLHIRGIKEGVTVPETLEDEDFWAILRENPVFLESLYVGLEIKSVPAWWDEFYDAIIKNHISFSDNDAGIHGLHQFITMNYQEIARLYACAVENAHADGIMSDAWDSLVKTLKQLNLAHVYAKDAAPVKMRAGHGKWKNREEYNDYLWAECSLCGFRVEAYKVAKIGRSSTDYVEAIWGYCPKCGAEMSV